MFRLEVKNDFSVLLGLISILIFIIVSGMSGSFRIVLGLAFILFFPGYVLQAAIFPFNKDLDGMERVVVSFGLSVSVVPVLILSLNYTPWGISIYPVVITLSLYMITMSLISIYRKNKIPKVERFKIAFLLNIPNFSNKSWFDKVFLITMVGTVIFAFNSFCTFIASPRGGQFSEFNIVNIEGMIEGYPRAVKKQENVGFVLGVANHEFEKMTYTIETEIDGHRQVVIDPFDLEHEEKWEERVELSFSESNTDMKVEFLLIKNGEEKPYRSLQMWMDVE